MNDDSTIVAYDDVGGMSAARAWWLLRWAGVRDVHVLDGGFGAWRSAGFAFESGDIVPVPGDVTVRPGSMPTIDGDGAARVGRDGVLLDARAAARYRGDDEPVDPVAGHIPEAICAPTADNLTASGEFLDAESLRERFADLGATVDREVAVYCGSGVTAAHQVAALAHAGIDAALYPGSWSQWCNDPARPVATGEAPS